VPEVRVLFQELGAVGFIGFFSLAKEITDPVSVNIRDMFELNKNIVHGEKPWMPLI